MNMILLTIKQLATVFCGEHQMDSQFCNSVAVTQGVFSNMSFCALTCFPQKRPETFAGGCQK